MGGVPRTHKGDYNEDGSRAVKPAPPVVEEEVAEVVIEVDNSTGTYTPVEKVKPRRRRRK